MVVWASVRTRSTQRQSQRDCVLQPQVAVLGYLGNSRAMGPNPKGVAAVAPSNEKSPLKVAALATLSGLLSNTTFRGRAPSPRVAEYDNPGLSDRTPFGVRACGRTPASCGKPSVSCGKASASCGEASASCGKTSASCGKPSASCGKASAYCGKASASCGEASASCGRAPASCGEAPASCGEAPVSVRKVPACRKIAELCRTVKP